MSRMSAYSQISRSVFRLARTLKILNRPVKVNGNLFVGEGLRGDQIHFHAASAGELEILWILIIQFIKEGAWVSVSVFSQSAERSLARLYEAWVRLGDQKGRLELSFSPVDGDWNPYLKNKQLKGFVTAKYEAWPELWSVLSDRKIPLFIVGARARKSLTWAKNVVLFSNKSIPQIVWLGEKQFEAELLTEFKTSEFIEMGDPRWDRVFERLGHPTERAAELLNDIRSRNEKIGILGSAWKSDWRIIGSSLHLHPSLIICVPHDVSSSSVQELKTLALKLGRKVWISESQSARSQQAKEADFWILNEMGLLVELYQLADWIYIGGGFEEGIHSTIEAAFSGLPLACGPKRFAEFPENPYLESQRQLTRVDDSDSFALWLKGSRNVHQAERERFKSLALSHCGSSVKICQAVRERLKRD